MKKKLKKLNKKSTQEINNSMSYKKEVIIGNEKFVCDAVDVYMTPTGNYIAIKKDGTGGGILK